MKTDKRKVSPIVLFATLASLVAQLLWSAPSLADPFPSRSLTLGSSAGGAVTTHSFTFVVPTLGNVGSIEFLYCTAATGACTTPAGLTTTSAALLNQSGATGFSIVNTSNGDPYISRAPSSVNGGTLVNYTLSNVVNPTAPNTQYWVRIYTYTSSNATGSPVDNGTVAFSTSNSVIISGTMPESLVFCVGNSGSDCTNIVGSSVSLGTFSPLTPVVATSVMAASTNASFGYNITVTGTSFASGANTIPPMGVQTINSPVTSTSAAGNAQFGMNLVANNVAPVGVFGSNLSGAGNGVVSAGYGVAQGFRFFSGDTVATASGPTKTNTYTASYIANVSPDQAAGVYSATLTYICTASF